jgi:hypothetical protein
MASSRWRNEKAAETGGQPRRAPPPSLHFDNPAFDSTIEFTCERWISKIIPSSGHAKGTKGFGLVVHNPKAQESVLRANIGRRHCCPLTVKPALVREDISLVSGTIA